VKTDGLFDYKVQHIQGKYGKSINLFFFGDEHFNSPSFARQKWESDCGYMQEQCKRADTYFIKTGDVFEALSTSERHAFVNSGFHDSNRTRWEKEYAREIEEYVKQASFQKNRTLAVFGGNHFFQFWDGTTSDMALAAKLNAPYIGVCGYVILAIDIDKYHSHVIKIFVHHGKSSGRTAGSAFNSLEQAASYFTDADIIVMGHDHKAGAIHLPAMEMNMGQGGHWKVKEKTRIIGRAGSYLKAYEAGVKSYAVDALYRPATLGCLQIILTPRREEKTKKDNRWIDIKAVI
jgi:hypothetical protein